jgi:hypothetical protein
MVVGVAGCRIRVATHHGWAETRMRTEAVQAMLGGHCRLRNGGNHVQEHPAGTRWSPESARALDLATKIAADDSAHIEIVHVREYMLAGRAGMQTTRANEEDSRRSSASRLTTWPPVGRTSR